MPLYHSIVYYIIYYITLHYIILHYITSRPARTRNCSTLCCSYSIRLCMCSLYYDILGYVILYHIILYSAERRTPCGLPGQGIIHSCCLFVLLVCSCSIVSIIIVIMFGLPGPVIPSLQEELMRGWRNTVGKLIEMFWLRKLISGLNLPVDA